MRTLAKYKNKLTIHAKHHIFSCTCPVDPVDCSINKIVIKTFLPVRRSQEQKRRVKNPIMAGSFCNSVTKCFFEAFTAVSGSSSAEEGCTDTNFILKILWSPSLLRKESLLDGFLCCKFCCRHWHDVEMSSFCLLTSMGLILISNCSLLHLHSNDMNSWKSFFFFFKLSL